jgi:SAM-dependent methyltransferase
MEHSLTDPLSTEDAEYADRLARLETVWWKRWLDVQRPYRWNLRRLDPGFTLDVGCGLGRNLSHLGGNGVGVDHNPDSVATARARGLRAFTPDEFARSEYAGDGRFDSLLCAHVVEHLARADAVRLLMPYLASVRRGGKVILITPQERGFRSDPTHVTFTDFDGLDALVNDLGLTQESRRSFPFPRPVGRFFTYNEFVVVARVR